MKQTEYKRKNGRPHSKYKNNYMIKACHLEDGDCHDGYKKKIQPHTIQK